LELAGFQVGFVFMDSFPIETKHPDGVHTLPKGTQVHVRNGRATEIRAPFKPGAGGLETADQHGALEEAGAFLGVEIRPNFWRVDRDWHVLTFPRAFKKLEMT
jgi:hypothetical protein